MPLNCAAATMLSGCVNLAPPHTRPPLPTAPDYPEGFANDVALGQRATEVSWHDFFADPQLAGLQAWFDRHIPQSARR